MTILYKKDKAAAFSRGVFASFFMLTVLLAPIAPVLQLSSPDEGIQLGVEVRRAEATFGNGYDYRRSITINESQVTGSGNLTNFPVLISFTEPEFRHTGSGGNVTDAQGDDIIFTSDSDGAVPLDYERERYTSGTGEIVAWVEVPTLDFDTNTVIYMFYGNASVTSSQENITGTWDADYEQVLHFAETSGQHLDSTSNNNDSTAVSVTTQGSAAGKIAGADSFNGTSNSITVADSATLDVTNAGTFEAWVNPTNVDTWELTTQTALPWLSIATSTLTGQGAAEFNGVDSVIVGETQYFAGTLCSNTTETFATSSMPIGGGTFTTWKSLTTTATGTSASTGGCQHGIDSDGQYLWHVTYSSNAASLGLISYATTTLDYASGAFTSSKWHSLGTVATAASAAEGSSIDVVVMGDRAYFAIAALGGTTHNFYTGSVKTDGSGWTGWTSQTAPTGGGASESLSVSIESGDDKLYYLVDGVANGVHGYQINRTTNYATGFSSWTNEGDSNGACTTDFCYADSTRVGGSFYHAAFSHDGTDTTFLTASSTVEGGTLTANWPPSRKASNGDPDGTTATNASDTSVETDGKNVYYSAYASGGTTASFFIASSSLPAHVFISKRNAYEVMQTGKGYVFDWAGRPTSFGTTTAANTFEHVVVAHDGTAIKYYINGTLKASTTVSTDFESNANNLLIGSGFRSNGTQIYYPGVIDEVRVSSIARSADWITTQYNNQSATSTFYTLGSEETSGGAVAPTVTTNSANAGFNSATLYGTKTGGDDAAEHGFAYSTDATLVSSVSTTTLGALTSNSTFSSGIGGLSSDATYYFRAYATTTTHAGYGAIKSFVTGNSTATRKMRLFEGFAVRLRDGKMLLHQQ